MGDESFKQRGGLTVDEAFFDATDLPPVLRMAEFLDYFARTVGDWQYDDTNSDEHRLLCVVELELRSAALKLRQVEASSAAAAAAAPARKPYVPPAITRLSADDPRVRSALEQLGQVRPGKDGGS